MKKQILIIHAASASGKTTWIKRYDRAEIPFVGLHQDVTDDLPEDLTFPCYLAGKTYLLDGDSLVQAATRWPTYGEWFKASHPSSKWIAYANALSIMTMLDRFKIGNGFSICVVFNGNMSMFNQVEHDYGEHWREAMEFTHLLVEIPELLHRGYVEERINNDNDAARIADGGSVHGFPANWRDAHNNRVRSRRQFMSIWDPTGSLIAGAFDEALDMFIKAMFVNDNI
uniref:Uncharacterized protein n=1 Tax=viral metagenome TaxID=1070528 RepID=A0A2V0R9Z1_9ZZZZ